MAVTMSVIVNEFDHLHYHGLLLSQPLRIIGFIIWIWLSAIIKPLKIMTVYYCAVSLYIIQNISDF